MALRLAFLFISCAVGLLAGWTAGRWQAGLLLGLLAGLGGLGMERILRRLSTGSILGAAAGLLLGVLAARFMTEPFRLLPGEALQRPLSLAAYVLLAYAGLAVGLERGASFSPERLLRAIQGKQAGQAALIVDTSAIIDGRIADICDTGFLEGPFVVPQFVLRELQHIADSADALRRTRGRRGLDVLQRMQKAAGIEVRIVEEDFPKIREVDAKLVALARTLNGKIVTTDFNLNKVCAVQGIAVLNVNELANALRPVVLPGESLRVQILKEGKEPDQGVAYLDDGTMVVVEHGRRLIGRKVDVTVSSVLQTTAGRMIFARPAEAGNGHGRPGGGRE